MSFIKLPIKYKKINNNNDEPMSKKLIKSMLVKFAKLNLLIKKFINIGT